MLERIKTFFECFFVWRVRPEGKPSKADVVGAFAFGLRKHWKPGESNKYMARLVEIIHEEFHLPIISQWEIDVAMKRNSSYAVIREHLKVRGKYLDTLEVADQMVEKMRGQDWKRVVIVAHRLHVWRCMKTLKKMGVEVIIPVGLRRVPFDSKSEQWYTRNWFFWFIREIPSRLFYFLKGWV